MSKFLIFDSVVSGQVLVIDPATAPIFLTALNQIISLAPSFLAILLSRTIAVVWSYLEDRQLRDDRIPRVVGINAPGLHLPVMLATAGFWTSDAWTALCLSWQIWKLGRSHGSMSHRHALWYISFSLFALIALLAGPLASLLVSRNTTFGFSGRQEGDCVPQYNFADNAKNVIIPSVDHHGQAVELLEWLGSFKYSWTNNGGNMYSSGNRVTEPVSQVTYQRREGCILNDNQLCDSRFMRTHMTSGKLSASQLGLWSGGDFKFSMEGYCGKLNSSTISRQRSNGYYEYSLRYANGAVNPSGGFKKLLLGQNDRDQSARRKRVIPEAYFVDAENNSNWALETLPPAFRDLDTDQLVVLTILPPIGEINQSPDDELYVAPQAAANFSYSPNQLSHIFCYEKLFLELKDEKIRIQTVFQNRTAFLASRKLPLGLESLLRFANNEFMLKPVRFLRENILLQSLSDTAKAEYTGANAPRVPFGAEMHRWAHIGTLDIASKATRAATGFYTRGEPVDPTIVEALQTPQLLDLCRNVRRVREGAVSVPLATVAVAICLVWVAAVWWIVEIMLLFFAEKGFSSVRAYLTLPATRPTALSMALTIAAGDTKDVKVHSSMGGAPVIGVATSSRWPRTSVEQIGESDKYRLLWGFKGLGPRQRIFLQ